MARSGKGGRKRSPSSRRSHKRQRRLNWDDTTYASDVTVRRADGSERVEPARGDDMRDFERRRPVGGDRNTGWENRNRLPATLPCDRCGQLIEKGERGQWHRTERKARHRRGGDPWTDLAAQLVGHCWRSPVTSVLAGYPSGRIPLQLRRQHR